MVTAHAVFFFFFPEEEFFFSIEENKIIRLFVEHAGSYVVILALVIPSCIRASER